MFLSIISVLELNYTYIIIFFISELIKFIVIP